MGHVFAMSIANMRCWSVPRVIVRKMKCSRSPRVGAAKTWKHATVKMNHAARQTNNKFSTSLFLFLYRNYFLIMWKLEAMYKSNWRMQIGKTLPTNFWWFSFMAYCLRYAQNLVAVFALLDILAFTQLDPAFRVINAARNPTKYGSNVLTQSAGSQHAKIPIHHVQWWLTRLWVCFNSFISH